MNSKILALVLALSFAGQTVALAQSDTITISYRVMASPANWKLSGTAGTFCRIYWSDGATQASIIVADGMFDTTLAEETLNIGFVEGDTCAVEGFIQVPRHDSYTIKITPYFSQAVSIKDVAPGTRLHITLVESDEVLNAEMLPIPTPTPWLTPVPNQPSEHATPEGSPLASQALDFVTNVEGTPIPADYALSVRIRQPVTYTQDRDEGDACVFNFGEMESGYGTVQLIVRDEGDAIIALLEISGTVVPSSSGWQCSFETWLALPPSSFYTVYLGDDYLRAYQASDFPLSPSDGIVITLPE